MLTGNILVFDIATVPDTATGSRIWNLEGIDEDGQAKAMHAKNTGKSECSYFFAHYLCKIVAISAALQNKDGFKIWSIGDANSSEKELLEEFFLEIERFQPMLVSWNGSECNLPVIHYRSLLHSVAAPRYWKIANPHRTFQRNEFSNGFHCRQIDLMKALSGLQPREEAPLGEIALLLGLPGKLGMKDTEIWDAYQIKDIGKIRNFCELDVLNTYLIYLKFEVMRGNLTEEELQISHVCVEEALRKLGFPHLRKFLQDWRFGKSD